MRPGYKQTEVGVIPDDWEIREVREFARVITGPFGTLLKASEYSESDGVPLISVGEIGDGYFRIGKHTPTIPSAVVKRLPQYLLCAGDVVFGRKGAVDRSALVSGSEHGWFLGSDGICIRPASNCHSPYLAAQFRGANAKAWLVQNAIGTTMASLNQGVLARAKIPFPPLPEQSAIATALSDVDALLSSLDALIAKKRDIKQAAMQQLLTGKTRLPGFGGQWVARSLGEVAHIKTGSRNNEDKVDGGEYAFFVRSEHIERIDTYTHDCEAILVPGEGRIGEIFHYVNGKFSVHQRVYAITNFNQGISGRFVYLYMRAKFGAWAMQNTVKATVDSLRLPTFQNFQLQMPPTIAEQTAIAQVLSDVDAELAALEARRDKTRLLKQGMMQELLTGKTRLV